MFRSMHLVSTLLSVAGLLVASAAADSQSDPVVVGQTFLARNQDPTDGSAGWALTSHGVAEKLFTVDQDGELVGQVAEFVQKISDDTWELTIKADYKFSDGTPVDAEHVAVALTELNLKNPSAQSSLGNMTVTYSEDLKVRIQSERPTHIMAAVLAEWAFVIYHKDEDGNFVFTGPYAIESFDADAEIDLVPNEHYDCCAWAERPNIKILKFADGHDLATGLEEGTIDIGFHLPIDTLPELRETEGVYIKSFEVGYHYMMHHNLDRLTDVRVRKALDLAIDRSALSQALGGGHGTRSLFPDNSPYYLDISDSYADRDAAAALLDEAGWVLNDNGRRAKNGTELSINLVAYPHRPGLVIMQPVIADALDALGITVNTILTGQDWDETQTILDDRTFDLMLWAQHTLPAGDPGWFLNSFFRSDGGNNHANLRSDQVDSRLDSLSVTEEHAERVLMSQAVQKAIGDEVPVSNLVTPFWHVGLSERMKDYEPWGSDYYVIRADLKIPEKKPEEDVATTKEEASAETVATMPTDEKPDADAEMMAENTGKDIAAEEEAGVSGGPRTWSVMLTSCMVLLVSLVGQYQ